MTKNTIVEIINQKHVEVKERIDILKDLLFIFNKEDVWDKIKYIWGYFNINLVEHFNDEEILIKIWSRAYEFQKQEYTIISRLLEEHEKLKEEFTSLEKIMLQYYPMNRFIREEFIEKSHNLAERLLAHAGMEDNHFFPLAKEKLTEKQLQEITNAIQSRT